MLKKPNFFIVGAPKCGTSSLFEYLSDHPEVFMPELKEPHFFNTDMSYRHITSMDDYLRLFDQVKPNHLVAGDGSTNYVYSSMAIPNILKFNPNSKFVLMLRNPLDVVTSLHKYLCYKQSETEPSIEAAWDLPNLESRVPEFFAKRKLKAPGHINYRECAKFGTLTERFMEAVPQSQRLIIFFEEFVSDTEKVFREVCQFLEISDSFSPEFSARNQSRSHHSPWLTKFFMYPPFPLNIAKRSLKRVLRHTGLTNDGNFYKLLTLKTAKTPIAADFQQRVIDHYREDIALLENLVERDLNSWSSSV